MKRGTGSKAGDPALAAPLAEQGDVFKGGLAWHRGAEEPLAESL